MTKTAVKPENSEDYLYSIVWEFNNESGIYPAIAQQKVLCIQLEQDGEPIDFLILEDPSEFTGEEFRDAEGVPVSWAFGMPNRLLECLEQVGARYLAPGLTRIPEYEF